MAVRNAAEVVYGGLVHPEQLPSPEVSLAYLYEKTPNLTSLPKNGLCTPTKSSARLIS